MNKLLLTLLAAFIYIVLAPTPVFAFDTLGFYCYPYTKTFEEGKHYIPINPSAPNYEPCWFEIPGSVASGTQHIALEVYKGTVGNAKLVFSTTLLPEYWADKTYGHGSVNFNIYDEASATRIAPAQDDNFFAVVHDGGSWVSSFNNPILSQFQNFFMTGSTPPNNNYQIMSWKWGAKPISEWDPVVIIPGILGSWEKNGTWVLDPLAHTYDNLVDTLKANGYVENQTLFTLPYDWEQSNVVTSQLLKQKIEQIKATCGCSKVDIVAHSMGGLVATHYIMSDAYSNDIDQLFMLGTPIAGTPKAYKTWESGEVDFSNIPANSIMNFVFSREASRGGYSSVLEYIRNKPIASIQELLPVNHNYLKQGSTLLQYPTGYPRNPFLENLIGNPATYYNKHKQVQTYVVTGNTGYRTPVEFVIKPSTQLPKWEHGEIVSTINGIGDGTVPENNSVYFSGPEKEFAGISHTQLASSSSTYIFSQLTGSNLGAVVGRVYDWKDTDYAVLVNKLAPSPSEWKYFVEAFFKPYMQTVQPGSKFIFITLFSPVDIQVTAPDGKKLGKDFVTGDKISEIPNAVYSGPIDEHEYILIADPLPGEYKVETIGTGSGAYTIAAARIDTATSSVSLTNGTTTLNQIISNTLFYSSTSTSIVITPPTPPVATSTPTTTPVTSETCVRDITKAYQDKWVTKKDVYQRLVIDCKLLGTLLKARDTAKHPQVLKVIYAGIERVLANMELLAKSKGNTKDAVLLITKITTWFRNYELPQ